MDPDGPPAGETDAQPIVEKRDAGSEPDAASTEKRDAMASAPNDTSSSPPGAIPLPMAVTAHYGNQGWFADEMISRSFVVGSTTIQQTVSTTGACAQRQAGAAGHCLEVKYTPPAGYAPPGGSGYAGVFFLTTVERAHPELTPPVAAGAPNWGAEPGRRVAGGATKISFWAAAASDTPMAKVSFRAGTSKSAALPYADETLSIGETPIVLGTAWTRYTLSISGSYESVVGAFAWIVTDTTKPAHFYLDGIVWEP